MWLQGYVNQGRNRQRKGLSQCIRVMVGKGTHDKSFRRPSPSLDPKVVLKTTHVRDSVHVDPSCRRYPEQEARRRPHSRSIALH